MIRISTLLKGLIRWLSFCQQPVASWTVLFGCRVFIYRSMWTEKQIGDHWMTPYHCDTIERCRDRPVGYVWSLWCVVVSGGHHERTFSMRKWLDRDDSMVRNASSIVLIVWTGDSIRMTFAGRLDRMETQIV